jgi:hypothetical protein
MSSLTINGTEFKSKAAAVKYTRDLLDSLAGHRIEKGTKEFDYFTSLLGLHKRFTAKCRKLCEIQFFQANLGVYNKYRDLLVYSELFPKGETFSWKKCIEGFDKECEMNLKTAYRFAIQPQIVSFKSSNNLPNVCTECQTEKKDYVVDHFPIRFEDILRGFLNQTTFTQPDSFDKEPFQNKSKFKTNEIELEQSWFEYHKKMASLRFICAECNVSVLNTKAKRIASKTMFATFC